MPDDFQWVLQRGPALGPEWPDLLPCIEDGSYSVHVLREGGRRVGFCVVYPGTYRGEACLMVAGFYLEPGRRSSRVKALDLLAEVADQHSCPHRFWLRTSRARGWLRALQRVEGLEISTHELTEMVVTSNRRR